MIHKKGNHIEPYAKTNAGVRDIDLAPELSALLKEYIGERKEGFLFATENGTMYDPGNLWRDGFKAGRIVVTCGFPKVSVPALSKTTVSKGSLHVRECG